MRRPPPPPNAAHSTSPALSTGPARSTSPALSVRPASPTSAVFPLGPASPAKATVLPPAPSQSGLLARSSSPEEVVASPDEPTVAEFPALHPAPNLAPPTLRPSASTVRPPSTGRSRTDWLGSFFWGALAVAFGASGAAVWWEMEMEGDAPAEQTASLLMTRLPGTTPWLQSAARLSSARAKDADARTDAAAESAREAGSPENDAAADSGAPNDSTASSPTDTAGAEDPSTPASDTQRACVERFFVAGSLPEDASLAYVCDATDLRNVKEQMHRDVVRRAAGTKSEALVSWGTLGWYQLPLLATARHACCEPAAHPTLLPAQHGPCEGLGRSIDELASAALEVDATDGERLTHLGREFAGRVQCLHRQGREESFGYTFRPSQQNREEFERRVQERARLLRH